MAKERLNITVTSDTKERLKQYAFEHHTSISQAITDWIWSQKVKNEQIRGQQRMEIRQIFTIGSSLHLGSRSPLPPVAAEALSVSVKIKEIQEFFPPGAELKGYHPPPIIFFHFRDLLISVKISMIAPLPQQGARIGHDRSLILSFQDLGPLHPLRAVCFLHAFGQREHTAF